MQPHSTVCTEGEALELMEMILGALGRDAVGLGSKWVLQDDVFDLGAWCAVCSVCPSLLLFLGQLWLVMGLQGIWAVSSRILVFP